MTTAITKRSASLSDYTPEQIQLVKNTVAVGATDDELKLFLQVCKNHKLDPFTRQVHFVKRKVKVGDRYEERGTFQVAIDGFRTIAERTGSYAGNDDPVFDSETKPTKATVTVWKIVNGLRCPFTATARWNEYVPTNYKGEVISPMWKKMPMLMLSKCAEALALRKAFPESLSGLYSDEEMDQAGKPNEPAEEKPAPFPPASAEQLERIAQLCKETNTDPKKLYEHFRVPEPDAQIAPAMIGALEAKLGMILDEAAKANS